MLSFQIANLFAPKIISKILQKLKVATKYLHSHQDDSFQCLPAHLVIQKWVLRSVNDSFDIISREKISMKQMITTIWLACSVNKVWREWRFIYLFLVSISLSISNISIDVYVWCKKIQYVNKLKWTCLHHQSNEYMQHANI